MLRLCKPEKLACELVVCTTSCMLWLRRKAAEPTSPEQLGELAHRLAGNESPTETARLSAQIIDGFYAGS